MENKDIPEITLIGEGLGSTPQEALRNFFSKLGAAQLGGDFGDITGATRFMGEPLAGEPIEDAEDPSAPAAIEEARSLVEMGLWTPVVGDIVQAVERITTFHRRPKPGETAVVTRVFATPQYRSESFNGYPLQSYTMALAMRVTNLRTKETELVEEVHDHRDFIRIGNIYDNT